MNSKRFYFLIVSVATLLGISIIASAVVGNNILLKRSEKLVSLKLDSKVLDEQNLALIQAKKDIVKYAQLESEAKAIVPQDKDQAEAVREIVKIASDSGIELSSITFPASTLGTTVRASGTKSKLTQVTAVAGITGVYVMPINIEQQNAEKSVSYPSFINFLGRLEKNRRTAQVAGVTIEPSKENPNLLTFHLDVNVYIKP